MENRFDALAKALNEEVSRRDALQRLAGGLAAGLLGLFGLSRKADAQTPQDCVRYCSAHYPPGPIRNECLQVCESCNDDPARVCGTPGNLYCCPPGTVCINGVCCPKAQACQVPGAAPICCPEGTVCINGQCCPRGQVCRNADGRLVCCPPGTACINGQCVGPAG